ncbi:MAG TPA: SDR family oxidoreductase [Victivallales bacterium]|nr:SDR family oxidoreductase [Victivallales bacterium]
MNKKIAIVTGGSRGIGKHVAFNLAQNNYHVILLSRTKNTLEKTTNKINSNNGSASYFVVDVSNSIQVKDCIDSIIKLYGNIDVLFNNAGIAKAGTSDISDSDLDELLKINLHGAIYVAKHVAQYMKKQKSGYIMNLSSMSGKRAVPAAGAYAATKFGLNGFGEALHKEMAAYGVKVTNICPSYVATDMVKDDDFDFKTMIETNDIVKTVNYLLSLSKNAVPPDVPINCINYVAQNQ